MTIFSILVTYCSWDQDLSYSALITNFSPGASASLHTNTDLENASSITLESHSGSTTKLEIFLHFGTHQPKGLQGQQKAFLKPYNVHLGTGLLCSQLNEGLKNQ